MREINRDVISVFLLAIVLLVLLSGQASANSVWTEYYHDNKNTGRGANAFYVEPSLEIEALDVINAQPGGKFTLTPTIRNTVVTAEGSTVNVSTNASVFGRDINNDTFVGNLLGNGSSKSAAYNITVPLTVGEHQINISANRINRDLNKPNDKTVMASAGFLSGWNYRKQKTINGTSAGAQTNYQMNLTLYNSTGNDTSGAVYLGGNTRSDFGDLRFTKSDGVTLLDYWIESYTSGTNATVWIEVDSIPASPNNTSIYLYYDNPSAISASNGTATFPFFDDFNTRSSIDTNKWTVNQGDQYISGGILVLATYDRTYIRSIQTFGVNTCVRTRVKIDTDAYDTGGDKGYVGYADGTGRPIADPYQDYTVLDWSTYANLGSLMFDTAVDSSHRAEPVFGSTSSNPRTTFVIDELRRLTSTVYVYENDSQLYAYSTAANIPTNAMPVVMGSAIWSTYYDGVVGSAQYDWILVRNFVSPEPTWALPTSTQTFAPSGYVFNNMGAGISGATVTIYNGTYANSVLTNGTGYYSMTLPADGTYTYVAAKDGYLNSTPTSQTFTNGGSTLTNITLDPSTSILLYSDFYSTDLANPTNIMKDSKVHFYYSTAPNANLSLKVEGPVPQVITDKADYTGSAEIDVNFPATGSYTVFIDKVNDQTTPTPQKYFFKATYDRFDLSIGFTPQVTVSGDTGTVGGSIGESAPRSISMRYNGDGTFTNQDILGTDAGLETSREVTAVVNVGPPSAALGPLTVGSADIGENVHINEGHGYGFKTISNDLTRADLYYGTGILVVPDLLNPIEPVYYEPIIGNLLQNPIKPYAEFNKIGVGLSGEGEAYFGMPYDKVGIKGSAGVGIEGSDNFADQKREISLYSPWEFGSSVLAWDNTTGGEVRSTAVYNFNGEFDSLKLSKSDTSTHITGTPETLFLGGIGKEADSETGYTIPSSEISKVSGTVTQNFVNSQTNIEDITLSPQTMLDEISASPIKSTYEKSGITGDSNILELPLKIKAIAGGGIDIRLTTDLLKEKLYESGITTDKIPEGWIAYPIIENPHKDYDLHNLSYKYLSVLFDKTQIENAISSKFRNLNITGKLLNATIVEFSELLGQHDLHIQVVDQYGRIVGFNSTTNSSSNNIPGALILQNSTIDNVTYKEVIIVPADLGITAFMDARQAENLTETYNLSISQFDNSTNSSAQTTVVGNITQGTLLKFKIHASNESLPSGYLNALPGGENVSSINIQATSNLSINITNITEVNESALYEINYSIHPEILSASYEPLNVNGKSIYKIVVNATDSIGRKPLVFLEINSNYGTETYLMPYNRSEDLYISYWIPKFVGLYTLRVKAYDNINSNGAVQDIGTFTIKRNVSSDYFRLNKITLPYNITYYRNGSVIDEITPDASFDVEFRLGNITVLLSNVTAPGISPTSPPGISLFENLDLEMNGTTYNSLGRYVYINPVSFKKYLGPNSNYASIMIKIPKPKYPFIATKSKELFYNKGLGTTVLPNSSYTISGHILLINTTYSPLYGFISTYPDISIDRVRIYGENKTFGNLTINATITNKGMENVKGVFVEFLVNGINISNGTINLSSGSSKHMEFYYPIRSNGAVNISIVADPFNAIHEVNKANNKYSTQINVAPAQEAPAPEAAIGFNTTSKDYKVYNNETGIEANYVTLPSKDKKEANKDSEKGWELRQYTLNQANNSLVLVLKHKKEGKEAAVEIISMQYNYGAIIAAPKNNIQADYSDEKGALKDLDQKIEVQKLFDAEAKYNANMDKTEIKMNIEGKKPQKETRAGIVILELSTDKGGLEAQIL